MIIAYVADQHPRGVAAVRSAQFLDRALDVLVDGAGLEAEFARDLLGLQVSRHPHQALPLAWRQRT